MSKRDSLAQIRRSFGLCELLPSKPVQSKGDTTLPFVLPSSCFSRSLYSPDTFHKRQSFQTRSSAMNDTSDYISTPVLSSITARGRPILSLRVPSQTSLDNDTASTPEDHDGYLLQFCTTPANLPTPDTSTVYMLPDPTKKSHAKKQPVGHVPRPRNAFILFRCDLVRQGKIPREFSTDHKNISKVAGMMWRSLSSSQKKPWAKMAELEKELHAERYPGYSYHPGRDAGDEVKGAERGCGGTGEGRRRERKTANRIGHWKAKRAVKKEEVDDMMLTWTPGASGLPSPMQMSPAASPMNQDLPRLHQPFPSRFHIPNSDYRIYQRRSLSCPPPASFPVSGEGVYANTPFQGRPLPFSNSGGMSGLPTEMPLGFDLGLLGSHQGMAHDDIVQARRPSRITMYHSYYTNFEDCSFQTPYSLPTPPSSVVSSPSPTLNVHHNKALPMTTNRLSPSLQSQNQSYAQTRAQTHLQRLPTPLPQSLPVNDAESSGEIHWTYPWNSSTEPDNTPSLISGPYRPAKPRDAPNWDGMRWEVASRGRGQCRDEDPRRDMMISSLERPVSPRTVPDVITVKPEDENEWNLDENPFSAVFASHSGTLPDVPDGSNVKIEIDSSWDSAAFRGGLGGLQAAERFEAGSSEVAMPPNCGQFAGDGFDGSLMNTLSVHDGVAYVFENPDVAYAKNTTSEFVSPSSGWMSYTQNRNGNISPSAISATSHSSDGMVNNPADTGSGTRNGYDISNDLGALFPRLSLDEKSVSTGENLSNLSDSSSTLVNTKPKLVSLTSPLPHHHLAPPVSSPGSSSSPIMTRPFVSATIPASGPTSSGYSEVFGVGVQKPGTEADALGNEYKEGKCELSYQQSGRVENLGWPKAVGA